MVFWDKKYLIDGKYQTPNEYLLHFYESQSNANISNVISDATKETVSPNAVRKRGRRMGLRKGLRSRKSHNVTESVTSDDIIITDNGNIKSISATVNSHLINSLDELLEFCKIDLDEWEIVRQRIGGWQQSKSDRKEQLVKIEIVLERKKRTLSLPQISPIVCSSTFQTRSCVKNEGRKIFLWGDVHFGYLRKGTDLLPLHDRNALNLIEQIFTFERFDEIYCLGDIFDFASYSTHFLSSPDFANTTQAALLEAHWILQRQRRLQPHARMAIIQGNHDKRPENAIAQYLAESYQIRGVKDLELPYSTYSVANLIDLNGLSIEWIDGYPNGECWTGNIRLSHGVLLGSKPGDTIKKLMASEDNEIQGHGHRMECAIVNKNFNRRRKSQISAMIGCSCHVDGRVPGHNPHLNPWQQGFGIVEIAGDVYNFTFIPITDNKCIVYGKVYEGTDYLENLKKDVKWNF